MRNRDQLPSANFNVVTAGEMCSEPHRGQISAVFGEDHIFDQYGLREVNSVAFECKEHTGLHMTAEHVAVEVLDDQGINCGEKRV